MVCIGKRDSAANECNSLANSALKRPTGTFGIFARNAIMLIRQVVFKFSGNNQTNVSCLSKC